ncbi:hypothetical protein [Emticicia sp. W12TSBA100-4]|jgi:hypothetical protein|uniref:hypothetical protein n=1 Tax=Emticicia sp. W12TSBA100-4 TaxID=3160965 RepID=UPI003305AD1F
MTDTILQVTISGDALFKTAQLLATKAKGNCLELAGIMLFIHFAYMLFKVLVFGESYGSNVLNLIRVVALMFLIGYYNELMGLVVGAINELANTYTKVDDILAQMKKVSGDANNPSTEASGWDLLTMDFGKLINVVLTAIQNGLSMIIRLLLENVKNVLVAFTYSVGIFATALSTVPGLGGTITHWFRSMLNILFWTLTLSILDNLVVGLSTTIQTTTQGSDIVNMLVINLALILMYLGVPLLTTLYIGSSAIGGIIRSIQGATGGMVAAGASVAGKSVWEKSAGARTKAWEATKQGFSDVFSRNDTTNRTKS